MAVQLPLPAETIVVLLMAMAVVAATWLYHARARVGHIPQRRPLPSLRVIHAALGRGAETGAAVHISPAGGTIGRRTTMAETVVGLLAAERVANEAALKGAPILVSSGDAVAHLAMRGILRQSYKYAGRAHDYNPANIQLLAHENATAYATGVMTLYGRQRLEASQVLGSLGQEFLLFSEEGVVRKVPQVVGTTSLAALPVLILNNQTPLIGEEVFAAEAYLSEQFAPQARLMTQDVLRTALILLIIGGVVYSMLQSPLGLPALPGV